MNHRKTNRLNQMDDGGNFEPQPSPEDEEQLCWIGVVGDTVTPVTGTSTVYSILENHVLWTWSESEGSA